MDWKATLPHMVFCIFQPILSGHLPSGDSYAWSQGCPLTEDLTVLYISIGIYNNFTTLNEKEKVKFKLLLQMKLP